MKYDAMKHQGSEGGNTFEQIGEATGESGRTVQRYVCLSNLTEGLLKLVDEKKLPFRSGVEISYLKKKEQIWVEDVIGETGAQVFQEKAEKIRGYSLDRELTKGLVKEILSGDKPKIRRISIKPDMIDRYFDENYSSKEIEETIIHLLDEWKEKGGT